MPMVIPSMMKGIADSASVYTTAIGKDVAIGENCMFKQAKKKKQKIYLTDVQNQIRKMYMLVQNQENYV